MGKTVCLRNVTYFAFSGDLFSPFPCVVTPQSPPCLKKERELRVTLKHKAQMLPAVLLTTP